MKRSLVALAWLAAMVPCLPASAQGSKPGAQPSPKPASSAAPGRVIVPPWETDPLPDSTAVSPPPASPPVDAGSGPAAEEAEPAPAGATVSPAPAPSLPASPTPPASSQGGGTWPQMPPAAPNAYTPPPWPGWYMPPQLVPAQPQKRWYGWQILIGLAISHTVLGAGVAAAVTDAPEVGVTLIVVGSAGHVFTGPITHWAHGYGAKGWAALGINAGVPITISATALANGYAFQGDCSGDFCGLANWAIAAVAGWVAAGIAPAVDIATLAYDKPPDAPPPGFHPSITGIVPMMGDGKTGLAIAGQF